MNEAVLPSCVDRINSQFKLTWSAVKCFSKIIFFYFLDTLILLIYFLITKITSFRGDLSDISAKTATPVV